MTNQQTWQRLEALPLFRNLVAMHTQKHVFKKRAHPPTNKHTCIIPPCLAVEIPQALINLSRQGGSSCVWVPPGRLPTQHLEALALPSPHTQKHICTKRLLPPTHKSSKKPSPSMHLLHICYLCFLLWDSSQALNCIWILIKVSLPYPLLTGIHVYCCQISCI